MKKEKLSLDLLFKLLMELKKVDKILRHYQIEDYLEKTLVDYSIMSNVIYSDL